MMEGLADLAWGVGAKLPHAMCWRSGYADVSCLEENYVSYGDAFASKLLAMMELQTYSILIRRKITMASTILIWELSLIDDNAKFVICFCNSKPKQD